MAAGVDQRFRIGKLPDDVDELGHDVVGRVGAVADASVDERQLQEVVGAAVGVVSPPSGS